MVVVVTRVRRHWLLCVLLVVSRYQVPGTSLDYRMNYTARFEGHKPTAAGTTTTTATRINHHNHHHQQESVQLLQLGGDGGGGGCVCCWLDPLSPDVPGTRYSISAFMLICGSCSLRCWRCSSRILPAKSSSENKEAKTAGHI